MQTRPIGPIVRGVVDLANASSAQEIAGAARVLRAFRYQGAHKLIVREGSDTKMTLFTPGGIAQVTSVCYLTPFADWALSVGHDALSATCYLYRLAADMSGWYDPTGVFNANQNAQPCGTLWTGIPDPPDVCIAEGLGLGYIAHTQALDSSTLAFPTKQYTVPGTIATLQGNLADDGSLVDIYFRGVVSFNQHLWGWSFGAGTTPAEAFRPELMRFSLPFFAGFQLSDSITLGDRVRSQREQVVGAAVAGKALFLGGPFGLDRITGYGRSSWFKEPLDKSFGFPGPKCMAVRGSMLYYWGSAGPMRCADSGQPEPIRVPVEGAVVTSINPETVVAGFDSDTDRIIFVYDAGTSSSFAGVRTWMAYDATRNAWLGPDDDMGLAIRYMSTISPVFSSAAAHTGSGTQIGAGSSPPVAPSAAPTNLSTSDITHTSAIAHWTVTDPTAFTHIEVKRQADPDSAWITEANVDPGVQQYTIGSLSAGVAYEWRVAHNRGGQLSDFAGPDADTEFTTIAVNPLEPLDTPAVDSLDSIAFGGFDTIVVQWSNPTPDASTEVWVTPDMGSTTPGDSDYTLNQTAAPLVSTATFTVFSSGTYWVRVRAIKDAFTPSLLSAGQSITVTVTGAIT